MIISFIAVILGFLLDLCFGDPHWIWHPVRGIGALIKGCEKPVRGLFPKSRWGERMAGVLLVFLIGTVSTGVPFLILWGAGQIHPGLRLILESIMCYQLFAMKSLKDESMRVYHALAEGDTEKARYAVSMIVGRDTDQLTEEGIQKAVVETVAENTADGILAPMIYMMIGGAVLGFLYKSINTMDSMIGYRNEKYNNLGCFAARLDDAANYIPARICAYLMIAASKIIGMDSGASYRIYKRDRYNHDSPNSAHTEAVMAGVLGIQLAGDAYYFGELHEKKTIGDHDRSIEAEDIKRSNRLLYGASFLGMILFCMIKWGVLLII